MKPSYFAFGLAALLGLPQAVLAGQAQGDQHLVFSDGTKVTTYDHCGDTDTCAVLESPNGDRLSIYSEGAAYCQPYVLHFVKTNGTTTIYEYSRTINHDLPTKGAFGITDCGRSHDTQMVMDHGLIHMTVTENHDGTLSIAFTPTEQGTMRQQSESAPEPSDTEPTSQPSASPSPAPSSKP